MKIKKSGSPVEIPKEELCFVGNGKKYHIKRPDRPYLTYCGADGGADIDGEGLISITDMCEDLCQNCLREYRRSKV